MKKAIIALLITALVLLTAASCGKNSGKEETPETVSYSLSPKASEPFETPIIPVTPNRSTTAGSTAKAPDYTKEEDSKTVTYATREHTSSNPDAAVTGDAGSFETPII